MPFRFHRPATLLFACLMVLLPDQRPVMAQQDMARQDVARQDVNRLRQLAETARLESLEARGRLDSSISRTVVTDSTGTLLQVMGMRDGRPFYYRVHNRQAVATIRADRLHRDGPHGWSLEGTGETVGVWDATRVRTSHIEFGGRVRQRDIPPVQFNHSTHVAGTIAAAGVYTDARGAAPDVQVDAWDWNDDLAEMALWAAEGGLISNHSYGQTAGWTYNLRGDGRWAWQGDDGVDPERDWRFGHYGEQAAAWDAVAAAAPGYLIVKSIGNEPADTGPLRGEPYWTYTDTWMLSDRPRAGDGLPGGYDTVLDASGAKNVLTVGAVSDIGWDGRRPSDMRVMDLSGRGPTDDGRIKPDVMASGDLVLSTMAWSDEGYGTSSGTSHAAPAVAGAAALLQQAARRWLGAPLSAAALKALFIHTADGMGAPGPEYASGWGLVNAEQAVRHLRTRPVVDTLLTHGDTHAWSVELAAGDSLQVTLAWTDPAGPIGPRRADDRTPALVHDLDIRVEGPSDLVFLPWTLDPDHPSEDARPGDNVVDPVEQVSARVAESGTYTIRISHKGSLPANGQRYTVWEGVVAAEAGDAGLLAGRVETGGEGVTDVSVVLSGPRYSLRNTGPDGSFLFDDLPAGIYELRVDGDGHVPSSPVSVTVPHVGPVVIDLPGAFTLRGARILLSPDLLGPEESERGTWAASIPAGGVFGVVMDMERHPASTSPGGRVILDTDTDPDVTPYMGQQADSWLTASADWPLQPDFAGGWSKRIPVLWVHGATPPGRVVRVPFRVLHPTRNTILAADTLRLHVAAPDTTGPIVRAHVVRSGEGYVRPGDPVALQAVVWDGSPLSEVEAVLALAGRLNDALATARLRDDGDLSMQQDVRFRDGVFTGVTRPPVAGDFRIRLSATDAAGNTTRTWTDFVVTTRPFEATTRLGVWTSSWFDSGTGRLWSALADAEIPYDAWDDVVRGDAPLDAFTAHDVLAWAPSPALLARADARQAVDAMLDAGRAVVLILPPSLPDPDVADWLSGRFGVRPVALPWRAERDIGELAGSFVSWPARPDLPVALGLETTDGHATILARTMAGPALATARNRSVVTTVPVMALREAAYRAGFLSRLLVAATADTTFAPPPRPPDEAWLTTPAPDSVLVSWSPRPFATYDVELLRPDGTRVDAVSTSATSWRVGVPAGTTDPDLFGVRIRTTTPAGSGPWETFRSEGTSTAVERAPFPAEPLIDAVFPNPATTHVSVRLSMPAPGPVTASLLSPLGRRVGRALETTTTGGIQTLRLDTSGLAAGVYLLDVEVGTTRLRQSVVVIRP